MRAAWSPEARRLAEEVGRLLDVERRLASLMPGGYTASTRYDPEPIGALGDPVGRPYYCATIKRRDGTTSEVCVFELDKLIDQTIHVVFVCQCADEDSRCHAEKRDRRAWRRKYGGSR